MDKEESQRLREAMKRACEEGDFEKVFELIKSGQDPRHTLPGDQNRKPLHYAAFHGNLEAVSTLIDVHHCNPRSGDKNNCTPLHYSCYGGHKNVVEYLVTKQKCNPMVKDHEGNLPLHFTCIYEVLDTYEVMGYHMCSSFKRNPTRDHFGVAKFLLKEWGCKVTRFKKHAYPLVVHLACRYGTTEFVQFLVEEKNCCLNNKNKDEDTPVHLASKYGNVEILRYLVEVKQCSLMEQNKDGNTPLHLACMFQHIETVQYLVKKQQDLIMIANHKKELPTHIACCEDSLEIVKLVTSPSNVIAKGHHNGATPLHVACVHGLLEVVKWLIEEMHCDPNIEDDDSLTPLQHLTPLHHDCAYACGYASAHWNIIEDRNYKGKLQLEIVKYLVASCRCDTMMNGLYSHSSLMDIACREVLELVKALTSYDVNCVDKYGNTPLHLACAVSQLNVVQLLVLEMHCRQDIQNNSGELPLHIACSTISLYITADLFETRNLVRLPTDEVPTKPAKLPLELEKLSLELVKLVSTDCEINLPTKSGDTPLHIACRHYQVDIVTYLIQEMHGDVNIANNEDELPLHIACQQRSLEMVKLVSSCDLHAQTKRGFTAMHIACMNGAMEIVEYLVQEKHWKLKSKLYDNLLIHCACVNGSAELVRKLANPTNVTIRFPNRYELYYYGSKPKDKCGTPGNIPLHDACKGANFEVVKILVEEFPCNYEDNGDSESDNGSDSGESGEGGNSGESGDGGNSGESGDGNDSGESGDGGNSGESGDGDDSGESGEGGNSGESGDGGNSGDSGDGDDSGDSGDNSESGDSGDNGESGDSGDSGDSDESGNSDDSGDRDESGDSWYTACDHWDSGKSGRELSFHLACTQPSQAVSSTYHLAVQNGVGDTPLHIACKHGLIEIVRYFSERCACDATIQNGVGDTPLHIACKHGQMENVRYLTEKCVCDPKIQNNSNKLAVHYACANSLEMVELVSDCDLESSTSDGVTPLHIACLHRKLDIVRYLIERKKCSPDLETSDGLTLLDYACGNTKYCNKSPGYTSASRDVTCLYRGNKNIIWCLIEKKYEDDWDDLYCDWSDIPESFTPEFDVYSYGKSEHSDATGSCSSTSECSYPKKEVNDKEKQAQAVVIRYLMSKCDYNPENVLFLFKTACVEGNLETAKLLCTNTDIVKLPDTKGNTPLHIACWYEHFGLVKFLVEERQCSQSVKNQGGELPLHIACCSKHDSALEMIKLVSRKCDVNAQTVHGDTPLHYACYSGVVSDVVQFLTEQCRCDQTIQNKEGVLPLHIACSRSSLEVVKLVCNCNVNAQTIKGDTSLHIAIKSRYEPSEVTEFLVHSKGADPSVLGGCGHSPIHEACGIEDLDLVKILTTSTTVNCQDKHGNTPLHIVCEEGKHRYCWNRWYLIAKFMVEKFPTQIDPSIQNHNGNLALHLAVEFVSEECQLLLTKLLSSCDPNVKNCDGNTPLHVACKHAAVQCIRYLVKERGCDVSVRNVKGELPLHIAVRKLTSHICDRKNLNAVKLVETDHEVNSTTVSGDTPLHIACRMGNTTIVQYLLKVLNCDPDMQTSSGDTALHLICKTASCWKDQDLLRYLLKKRHCNPDTQNANEETPLHIACQLQDLRIVKTIGKFVHNPNLTTLSGDTPLHVACKSKKDNLFTNPRTDIVRYLVMMKKCDQTIANNKGELPLHLACMYSVELVKLVSNCNINSQTADGNTPLHIAFYTLVRWVLEIRQPDANIQNQKRESPLHIPFNIKNKMEIAKYLIETRQCDANIQNQKGESPLHIVCARGNLEFVRLVENCDVNAKTNSGDTPLHTVCRSNSGSAVDCYEVLEIVKYLVKERHCDITIQNKEKELPLHIACQNCSLDVIKLVSKCNVELQTVSGDTPLHLACKRGDPDIVEYLITVRHCNPRVHNSDNELPLHIACETFANLKTVKLLCNSDIDVNTKTYHSGNTPLHHACKYSYAKDFEDVVKYLVVEKSGDLSIQNNNRQLPLHIACSSTNISLKIVKLLSNYDTDFNSKTLTGDTPLHEVCKVDNYYSDKRKQVVRFLVENKHCDPNCQNNTGMTPLHYTCKLNAEGTVLYLLSTGKVEPSISAKNSDGQTPIMCTNDIEIIRELLKHGADPQPLYQRYEKFFNECSSESPPPTPFNVLVLGNASTGKTTLIESLKAEGKLVVQDTNPDAHTAGIIPNSFESKEYGLVTFYDFAGQHEYYASHEAVIRIIARSTPPVIILLVNISESEENTKQKILYWLSFISNQFPTVTSKPHLIITGSHADIVADHGGDPNAKMKSIKNSIKSQLEKSTAKFVACATMDCRYSDSEGMSSLRQNLEKSSKELKDHGVMNFMSHCFHIYLLEYFKDLPAVSLSQITSCLLQKSRFEHHTYFHHTCSLYKNQAGIEDSNPKRLLPTRPSEIDSILEELSEKGHVILLKSSRRQFSWVILNKQVLLGDINGTVFAPVSFQQYKELASSSSTGVVPFSTIANHFPEHDPNMIVSFLSHLEFCHEIVDEEVLNLIEGKLAYSTTSSAYLGPYFLFPHLVSIECPQHIWRPDENFEYKCGWLLWCSEDHHFFTSRFLQVIILRLAFSFALDIQIKKRRDHPAIQRHCSIWKNGISWLNADGIEVVVEMREQNQVVAVMMRCDEESETRIECIHLRSSLFQKILRTKEEFCSEVSTTEAFINPNELQYPLRPPQDLTLFSLSDVARSVINKKRFVICSGCHCCLKLENLLLFEPYADLGENILKELFDEEKKDTEVTDEFLNRIANKMVRKKDSKYIDYKKECFLQLFDPLPASLYKGASKDPIDQLVLIFQHWRDRSKDRSFGGLRKELDEYSVFCGRNPLVRFCQATLS